MTIEPKPRIPTKEEIEAALEVMLVERGDFFDYESGWSGMCWMFKRLTGEDCPI